MVSRRKFKGTLPAGKEMDAEQQTAATHTPEESFSLGMQPETQQLNKFPKGFF